MSKPYTWTIGPELRSGRFGGPTIRDADGSTIAIVVSGSGRADANARKIAASPELAAALRAYASLRKRWQDDDEFGTVEFLDALGDLQPQIAAALARLEGGAS